MGKVCSTLSEFCKQFFYPSVHESSGEIYHFLLQESKLNNKRDGSNIFININGSNTSKTNISDEIILPNKNKGPLEKIKVTITPLNDIKKLSKSVKVKKSTDDPNEMNLPSPLNHGTYQNKVFKHKVTLNDFKVLKVLGKGAFGTVCLVYNEELCKYFAMKTLKKNFIKKYKQIKHTKIEREILEKIDYPFIAQLFFAFQNKEKLYMVTEYMPGGEMFYHLHREEYFNEDRVRFYIAEIVLAINHLHLNNIIYRDLKPENILLDEEGHVKLTDFGLSKIVNDINKDRTYTVCGTPAYVAPEVLVGKGYNKMVDWWSTGILLYELLCGQSPFREARETINIEIFYRPLIKDSLIRDDAFDLIQKLCKVDVNKRLGKNVSEIQNHKFFKTIDWVKLEKKEIEPPFKPLVKYKGDVSNFDTMFTDMSLSSYKSKDLLINSIADKKGYNPNNNTSKNSSNNPINNNNNVKNQDYTGIGASYEDFTYVKRVIK